MLVQAFALHTDRSVVLAGNSSQKMTYFFSVDEQRVHRAPLVAVRRLKAHDLLLNGTFTVSVANRA